MYACMRVCVCVRSCVLACMHGQIECRWLVVSECECDMQYHFHIHAEMACIRLGENAGVMDLAVKCTLQVSIIGTLQFLYCNYVASSYVSYQQ